MIDGRKIELAIHTLNVKCVKTVAKFPVAEGLKAVAPKVARDRRRGRDVLIGLGMTMDDNSGHQTARNDFAYFKDFLFLVPLLGSALAIIFDVGYFSGIGLGFFSLFSLSEHLVFAMEASPFGILTAFTVGLLASFQTKMARKFVPPNWAVGAGLVLTACVIAVALFFIKVTVFNVGMIIGAGLFSFAFGLHHPPLRRAAFVCMAAMVLAFSVGYDFATTFLESVPYNTTIETKNDGKVDVKLIRSGDRGVLFLDSKTNRITLLRWDEIKQISRAARP